MSDEILTLFIADPDKDKGSIILAGF